MDEVFKALKDPTRRSILQLLKGGEMTAGEIAQAFDISKPSISHHLNLLKWADLIIVGVITLIPVAYAYRLPAEEEEGDLV